MAALTKKREGEERMPAATHLSRSFGWQRSRVRIRHGRSIKHGRFCSRLLGRWNVIADSTAFGTSLPHVNLASSPLKGDQKGGRETDDSHFIFRHTYNGKIPSLKKKNPFLYFLKPQAPKALSLTRLSLHSPFRAHSPQSL